MSRNKFNQHEYYLKRKEEYSKWSKEYRKTMMGRACHLVSGYILQDKRRGFDRAVDFDAQWLIDNILTKPCAYCGETDWHKLGCNRLDHTKPHSKDNVEPCCYECNTVKLRKVKIYQYSKDKELVKVWDSLGDCIKETSFARSCIQARLRGKWYSALRKKWYYGNEYKGYIWSYEPL